MPFVGFHQAGNHAHERRLSRSGIAEENGDSPFGQKNFRVEAEIPVAFFYPDIEQKRRLPKMRLGCR
jgi:hypothetical protein